MTKTSFVYSLKLSRLSNQYLLTSFFQSFLLWTLAYITMFISVDNFSDRFMGAVTALLVLAALLAALSDQLPKTAYFKFVDLWFTWFICNILVIILGHIVIDYLNNATSSNASEEKIKSQSCTFNQIKPKNNLVFQFEEKKSLKINNVCKLIIPLINGIFLAVFFFMIANNISF